VPLHTHWYYFTLLRFFVIIDITMIDGLRFFIGFHIQDDFSLLADWLMSHTLKNNIDNITIYCSHCFLFYCIHNISFSSHDIVYQPAYFISHWYTGLLIVDVIIADTLMIHYASWYTLLPLPMAFININTPHIVIFAIAWCLRCFFSLRHYTDISRCYGCRWYWLRFQRHYYGHYAINTPILITIDYYWYQMLPLPLATLRH